MDRELLVSLVEEGLTTRQIAERLRLSQTTIRHWLRRHGLKTRRTSRRLPEGESRVGFCPRHGDTECGGRPGGYWRCLRCRSDHVANRRRRVKRTLVDDLGGACSLCGYDRCVAA